MISKNDIITLLVDSFGAGSEGIGRHEGMAVFIPLALPGESVRAQIVKIDKRFAFARLLEVLERSPQRAEPPCPFFSKCGGCSCQHMEYQETLRFKREKVQGCLSRIGGLDIHVPPVAPMQETWHYRNKTALPAGGSCFNPVIGFYAPRSHRLVAIDRCLIAKPESDNVASVVKFWMRRNMIEPYNEETGQGLVRHVMSRVSRDGRVMAVIVVNGSTIPHEGELVQELRNSVPGLCSVCLSDNHLPGNVILGPGYRTLWGADRLPDRLFDFNFLLSPMSFFQINPVQTECLYQTALEYAAIQKSDTVVDIYCGAGTISLLLAGKAAKVIGIDIVQDAIRDARENASRNGVGNTEFIRGAAEDVLPDMVRGGLKPDVIVLDPPRKGADAKVISAIANAMPARIVYISCDPATQARDAKVLCGLGYGAAKSQSFDMFCWTDSVENVMLFTR